MVGIGLGKYRNRFDKIEYYLNRKELTDYLLNNLLKHTRFINRSVIDLKENHKEIYETRFRDLLLRSKVFLLERKRELFREYREDLQGSIKKHSRWVTNAVLEYNESIKEQFKELSLKEKRDKYILTICDLTGEAIIYEDVKHTSDTLGINTGIIYKCIKNNKTVISETDGFVYSFEKYFL